MPLPSHVLVFDAETTVDETQALNFGSWRYYRAADTGGGLDLICLDEGLFFGHDLRERYRSGYNTLVDYRQTRRPAVDPTQQYAALELALLPQRGFVDEILLSAAFELRAWIVGFNLPFDLSRVAFGSGYAKKHHTKDYDSFEGGFSLPMAMYRSEEGQLKERSIYRPRVAVKTIDSKRHLIGLRSPAEIDEVHLLPDPDDAQTDMGEKPRRVPRGHFVDLRTLAFALTDESYTLERACEDFNVEHGKMKTKEHGLITPEYIDYNRRDVRATAELFVKLMNEYQRHDITLPATHAYSPASIGKAYLRTMGIRPVLDRQPDFDRDVLGYAMAAYFGGRTECRIRRVEVPVVYCDFLSMYPTVNGLMGLWGHLTAAEVGVEEATDEIRSFVDSVTLEDCFDPALWRKLPALVEIEPDADMLPTRADYTEDGQWQIGLNPLTAERSLWYTLPDVVASKLLTGRTPMIVRAFRLTHIPAKADALRNAQLRRKVSVDPETMDFFQTVIESRKSLPDDKDRQEELLDTALKILANATSYGIFAEIVRRELGGDRTEPAYLHGLNGRFSETVEVKAVEVPGEFSFPPLAACITAAARLMLAMAERLVTDRGGSYVFCDTDSMAIVATEHGDTIVCPGGTHTAQDGSPAVKALTWQEIDDIRAKFDSLNPYDPAIIAGSILEIEKQNYRDEEHRQGRQQLWCYDISAKRYVLYNRTAGDTRVIRKASQHGLGHLLNPTDPESEDRDWINQAWKYILDTQAGAEPEPLEWFDRPAIGRLTVSTPTLHKPFKTRNTTPDDENLPYAEQVKPFNFMLTAHIAEKWKRPTNAENPDRFQLIAPWNPDPGTWLDLEWIDRYSPSRATYRITTEGAHGRHGTAIVSTYGTTIHRHARQPEPKSLTPAGRPASGDATGLLRRRPVTNGHLMYIGKEADKLEEVDAGLHHNLDDVLTQHDDPDTDFWTEVVLSVMADFSLSEIAEATGLNRSTISRTRNDQTRPHPRNREALLKGLARLCRPLLKDQGIRPPRDPSSALVAYLRNFPKG